MPKAYYDKIMGAGVKIAAGGSYNVTLNAFGQFFDISSITGEDRKSGFVYVTNLGENDTLEGALGYIRFINQKGEKETAWIAEKAVVYNQKRDSFRINKGSDIYKVTKNGDLYTGIAVIEKDEYDMVKKIFLPIPVSDTKSRENTLGTISEGKEVFFCKANGVSFFEGVIPTENCIIYDVPETVDGETESRMLSLADFSTSNRYNISAYNFNSGSVRADCSLVDTEVSRSLYGATDVMYVVDDIYQGIYDEEPATTMKVHSVSNFKDVETMEIPVMSDVAKKAGSFADQKKNDIELKRGDIICIRLNDGRMDKAYLVYCIFAEEGASPLYGTDRTYSKSAVDEVRTKYNSSQAYKADTNPYGVYPEVDANGIYAPMDDNSYYIGSIRCNGMRFFGGCVYNLEGDKFLTYTSQPLSTGFHYDEMRNYVLSEDGESDARGYLTETVILPNKYVVVEVSGRKINVRNATPADIATYKASGSSCSEAFVHTSAGSVRQLVLINRQG